LIGIQKIHLFIVWSIKPFEVEIYYYGIDFCAQLEYIPKQQNYLAFLKLSRDQHRLPRKN
jgi:hypothetical protein